MSISLNDLTASNKNEAGNKMQAVSINDIPTTETSNENNAAEGFIEAQLGALDGLVNKAKVAREQFEEEHKNDAVAENLENFDPSDLDGPVMPSASTETKVEKSEETASETVSEEDETAEETTDTVAEKPVEKTEEAKPVSAREAKEEQEFNNIFDDDSTEDDDLLKIINGENSTSNEDEQEPELTEEEKKKIIDEYKDNVTSFYSNKRVSVNTSGFKVSSKCISISDLLSVKEPEKRVSDWVLTTAKRPFSTVEYKGLELQKINPNNARNRNSINAKKEIYRTLYNHIVGATKEGFEAWLKSTPYSDVTHYYFGAYKATFGDLNVITYQCPNTDCNNVFIKEQPIEAMYEIDDDFKDEFETIFNGDTSLEVECKEEIIPVSNQFAIGWLAEPSIYGIEIEPLLIDQETSEKYSRIINLIPFINRMYYIDSAKGEFIPIDESPVAKNLAKTVKNKLAVYYNILMSLNTDQLAAPQLRVYNYSEKVDKVRFFEPACNCPKCGRTIEKQETNAVTLLFSRAQSPLAANS